MRNERLRDAKATSRAWYHANDLPYLLRVIDECRAGTFCYASDIHCLRGLCDGGFYGELANSAGAFFAEAALYDLGTPRGSNSKLYCEHLRRVRTLAICKAELRRRVREAVPVEMVAL